MQYISEIMYISAPIPTRQFLLGKASKKICEQAVRLTAWVDPPLRRSSQENDIDFWLWFMVIYDYWLYRSVLNFGCHILLSLKIHLVLWPYAPVNWGVGSVFELQKMHIWFKLPFCFLPTFFWDNFPKYLNTPTHPKVFVRFGNTKGEIRVKKGDFRDDKLRLRRWYLNILLLDQWWLYNH